MTPALHRERHLARSFSRLQTVPGQLDRFIEPFGPGLHHLFVLRLDGIEWVGRKILQHNESAGWHLSSLLQPWMLLGHLIEWQWGNQGAVVYFRAVDEQEKHSAFHAALTQPESEVRFPFPLMDKAGRESICRANDWQCDASLAARLNADEAHFREHCAALLKTLSAPGAVILDPACSTGEFIAHLAHALPDRQYLGSDRSASMIEHALRRHGHGAVRFSLGDARLVAASGIRCDVLVLRFLNAEVMTRKDAQGLFTDLVACVKPGGTILLFGHTPVLLGVPYLAQVWKLALISRVAARPGRSELFQFYQLRMPLQW
ncbi:trans-aconitate 2-methyltransferase [Pseudomonas sp. MYb118]|uniref:trans-aconitate 2-methyltransferase n=1 Tax=Pseudomonas sp. MYb118 TaxID=1848720 RepID=UPI0034CEC4C0